MKKAELTLSEALRGRIIFPGDADYDEARLLWNGMIDKHPAGIVQCAGVADVITAVRTARKNDIAVSVRGGGHNVAGKALCDDGMVIDLSRMKAIRVDPTTGHVRAEGGVSWGEFDHETQIHGLAATGGIVSTTGIAGFTLGGGIGWLMRKYGLACDNLVSADVITAEGMFLKASDEQNQDLFWGIRGGGGNFGIVTSFKYRLHPVGPVTAGRMIYAFDKAGDVLTFYRNYAAEAPDELSTMAAFMTVPVSPSYPASLHGRPALSVIVCYAGPPKSGEEVLSPLRKAFVPETDSVRVMPYTELQSMFDGDAPWGLQNYWKSEYLAGISDGAIEIFLDYAARMSSPLSQIHIQQLQGAVSRVGEADTAFSHRNAAFVVNIVSKWRDAAESERHIRWTRELAAAITPFTTGGVYVNFLGEEGEGRVRDAYGPEKYRRLSEVKKKYDPDNFFRLNQNIKPAL
jgi:FAD/FMN-containing dehydrogenase